MGKSAEGATMASLLKGTKSAMVVADGSVAIRIKYDSDGTVTSVTNDISTDLVLVSSDGGTETFAYATYATVGALADAIDASNFWRAEVLDGLRSDATDDMFVDGAISISSTGYYDVTVDTTAQDDHTYRCKYDRNVGDAVPGGNHRVSLLQIKYLADISSAQADGIQVFEYDRATNTETQVYQSPSVDDTDTTITFASGKGAITSGFGNDLIVRITDDTSVADSGLYLSVLYDRE